MYSWATVWDISRGRFNRKRTYMQHCVIVITAALLELSSYIRLIDMKLIYIFFFSLPKSKNSNLISFYCYYRAHRFIFYFFHRILLFLSFFYSHYKHEGALQCMHLCFISVILLMIHQF